MRWLWLVLPLAAACTAAPIDHTTAARHFADVRVPTSLTAYADDSFHSVRSHLPFTALWDICLNLATQTGGILALERPEQTTGRFVFMATGFQQPASRIASKFVWFARVRHAAVWLAVEVHSGADGARVTAAWLPADTWQPEAARVSGVSSRDPVALAVAASAIRDFLEAVSAALEAPHWAAALDVAPERPPRSSGTQILAAPSVAWEKYSQAYGEASSAVTRSARYVLWNTELSESLQKIAVRIGHAANTKRPPRVYVYASDGIEPPFSVANGDLFVGTGFLRHVRDTDELAAVLAHEIDHVVQSDPIERLHHRLVVNDRRIAFSSLVLLAGAIPGMQPSSATSASKQVFEAVLASAAMLAGYGIALAASTELGDMAVSNYATEQELRADHNATIYLWRAGFRPSALQELLARIAAGDFVATRLAAPARAARSLREHSGP